MPTYRAVRHKVFAVASQTPRVIMCQVNFQSLRPPLLQRRICAAVVITRHRSPRSSPRTPCRYDLLRSAGRVLRSQRTPSHSRGSAHELTPMRSPASNWVVFCAHRPKGGHTRCAAARRCLSISHPFSSSPAAPVFTDASLKDFAIPRHGVMPFLPLSSRTPSSSWAATLPDCQVTPLGPLLTLTPQDHIGAPVEFPPSAFSVEQ